MVLFHNVTEQRRLLREQEEAAALQKALRRCERLALMRLDHAMRIAAVDETFCGWTGFKATELAGHRFADLVAGAGRLDTIAAVDRALQDSLDQHMQLTILGRKGEEITCELAAAPILSDYAPIGVSLVLMRGG
jgi:PAS domain S-box-containing protein